MIYHEYFNECIMKKKLTASVSSSCLHQNERYSTISCIFKVKKADTVIQKQNSEAADVGYELSRSIRQCVLHRIDE